MGWLLLNAENSRGQMEAALKCYSDDWNVF